MVPYKISVQELVSEFKTDGSTGLKKSEVPGRLEKYGSNKLQEEEPRKLYLRFLDQLKDVMIIILLIAAAISFIGALIHGDASEFIEPLLILLIVILNAVIGLIQENRAEKSLNALKDLSAPRARVIRDGQESIIDAKDLVPGDLIYLEAGDFVPADARLVNSSGLKADESALTGESVPAEKNADTQIAEDAPLGDRLNMVYSGCAISYGTGLGIVTATGMDTEIGKIAGLINSEKPEDTPLQQRLSQLGKYLGIVAIIACAIIFVIGMISGSTIYEMLMVSVSLAVSAIPEGLPAIVTVILSIGVQQMAKKNAIVKKLHAVETLGGASVICSDKTGTLTMNKMTVTHLWAVNNDAVTGYSSNMDANELNVLLQMASLCCDATVQTTDGKEEHIGDPTETAIIKAAADVGINKEEINERTPRVMDLPFDSDRKLMTTVHEVSGKGYIVVTKGAIDAIRGCCVSGHFEKAEEVNIQLANEGIRVLAVAIKTLSSLPDKEDFASLESNLNLLGLIGMVDPPRSEAKDAVALCRKAGIKPVMITGDHKMTAVAIAKQLGIYTDGDKALTGSELTSMSDNELISSIEQISVYARVSPQDKIRIVKAWKSKDAVVAMTGDGVNDAPALKAADIGCAMGITGTDVAKDSADIVLTDDNFATIVTAVKEGRGIYDNIKKVVIFLLGTNIGEILTVFLSMLLWKKSPLISVQLLWINLVTDSLPAIALGMEPVHDNIMDRQPRPRTEGIVTRGSGIAIGLQGTLFAVLTLVAFWIGHRVSPEAGRTMAFSVLAISQIIHSFSMRSDESLLKIGPFTNSKLNISAGISVLLVAILLFINPITTAFGMVKLSAWMYVVSVCLAIIPLPVMEIIKALRSPTFSWKKK